MALHEERGMLPEVFDVVWIVGLREVGHRGSECEVLFGHSVLVGNSLPFILQAFGAFFLVRIPGADVDDVGGVIFHTYPITECLQFLQ